MVNAQQYIENNFPKHVSEIIARNKNLEGDLDLTEYTNLRFVTFMNSSRLTSLKLPYSPQLDQQLSIAGTGITDFSSLLNLPNVREVHLPRRTNDNLFTSQEVGRVVQSLTQAHHNQIREKDQEIERLKQQIAQLQSSNQQNTQQQQIIANLNNQVVSLNQTLAQVNNTNNQLQQIITSLNQQIQIREKDQEIERLKQQIAQLQSSNQQNTQQQQIIANLNNQVASLNQTLVQVNNTNNQLQQTITSLNQQIQARED